MLDRWEKLVGRGGAEAVAKDRQTVQVIEAGIKGFRKNPQAFNGRLGFTFFEWLDDGCRNALLSAMSTSNMSAASMMDGGKQKAGENIDLAKDFSNVSTVFYKLSENVGALYSRYSEGIEQLALKGAKTASDCANALKQKNNN